MFQKIKTSARAAAESAGIVAPSVADAQAAAERHRQALIAAQGAADKANDDLNAAHDRGAPAAELTRLEAALVASRLEVERCERRAQAAERRLVQVQAAEGATAAEKGRIARDAILVERQQTADAIAKVLKSFGENLERMDKADEQLYALQTQGHVSRNVSVGVGGSYGPNATRAHLRNELDEILIGRAVEVRQQPFEEWVAYMNKTASS